MTRILPATPTAGYAEREGDIKRILYAVVTLLVIGVVAFLLCFWAMSLFGFFSNQAAGFKLAIAGSGTSGGPIRCRRSPDLGSVGRPDTLPAIDLESSRRPYLLPWRHRRRPFVIRMTNKAADATR